jgi:hypothetical protein
MGGSSESRSESLVEVCQQVLYHFYSDRNTQQRIGDPEFLTFAWGQSCVRGSGRAHYQRLDAAETWSVNGNSQSIDELPGRRSLAQFEREYRSKASKQRARAFMIGMSRKVGIVEVSNNRDGLPGRALTAERSRFVAEPVTRVFDTSIHTEARVRGQHPAKMIETMADPADQV